MCWFEFTLHLHRFQAVDSGGANGSGAGMSEAARSLVSSHLSGAAAKDKVEAVAVELLSGGSVADANAMAATVLVEKVFLS